MYKHLTVEQRQLVLRLHARGLSLREIGPQVGCSHQGVALIVRYAPRRPVRQDAWVAGPGRSAPWSSRPAVGGVDGQVGAFGHVHKRVEQQASVRFARHDPDNG